MGASVGNEGRPHWGAGSACLIYGLGRCCVEPRNWSIHMRRGLQHWAGLATTLVTRTSETALSVFMSQNKLNGLGEVFFNGPDDFYWGLETVEGPTTSSGPVVFFYGKMLALLVLIGAKQGERGQVIMGPQRKWIWPSGKKTAWGYPIPPKLGRPKTA